MRIGILIIFIFGIFRCTSPVIAQNSNYIFEKLPSEIGWTDETINDILQDYKGFVWMATWSGLKKYDGYSIKSYSQGLDIENGLNGNKIKCLFEDSKKRLWVGTNYTGFYLYDRDLDKFIQYQKDNNDMNSLSNNHVLAINEDSDGYIWIGTENGLNRFSPETEDFIHFENSEVDEKSKGYKGIVSIVLSEDGNLWVGCEVGLDLLVKGKNGAPDYFIKYYLTPEDASAEDFLRHNFILEIVPSKIEKNTLWIGTSIGVKKLKYFPEDKSKIEFETYVNQKDSKQGLSHSFVSDIYEDSLRNQLWIGTYNGINLLNIDNGQFQYFTHNKFSQNSIKNNVVHCLYKDRSDNLWIGTDKGINYINFSSKPFISIQLAESEQDLDLISSLKLSNDKKGLWIATNGTGLGYIPIENESLSQDKIFHYPIKAPLREDLSGFISDLIISDREDIWLTTKGAGLLKIPNNRIALRSSVIADPIQYTMDDRLEDDYLMTLFQSNSGAIWLGYWDNGLGRLDPDTEEVIHFDFTNESELNLKMFPIVYIFETVDAGKNILWVGSRGGGLYKLKYDNSTQNLEFLNQYHYEHRYGNGISNNFINSIYQSKSDSANHKLWIGTESGLNILDTKKNTFTYIDKSNGLKNNLVQAILEDEAGNMWVSTSAGISQIKMKGDDVEVINFDKYDGLKSDSFFDKSCSILDGGQLIFGGINGLTYFTPGSIKMNDLPPRVSLVDFRIFNETVPIGELENGRTILEQSISETESIDLTHRDNVLSFEFVGLLANEPQKLKFAYKLEGFNEDWVYTDASERIAHFTNLPYESFQFKVKAANANGVWSEPNILTLNVSPPFWMTNWAYLLYFIIVGGLLHGIFRVVKMRSEFNHSLQLEKVEREKLQEVNKMKLQFFTNISHELRTPLTLIVSPLEQFIKEKSLEKKFHKSIVRMHDNAHRLLTMINQLLDIRKNDAGLIKLKAAEGNFAKFTNEIMLSFKGLAKQRKIKLKFYPQEDYMPLWFDRSQMEKVWFNLLSNALKFTPEGGRIEVHLIYTNEKNDFLTIKIKDTGIGIPENQREHIFDRFYQVEMNSEEAEKGGTGIGLALSKSIVESHHGNISVEGNERQGGSTFVILLPLGNNHFSEDERIPSTVYKDTITKYLNTALPKEEEVLIDITESESELKPSKTKALLLIVEDNEDIRAYLNECLEEKYRILQAENGEVGLAKAIAELPDLILADISMPKMDGIEMCSQLKSKLVTSHIPIILLTARTSLIFKIDGVEKGADDYVTKPFNMQLLEARIKNLIRSRNKLKEKFAKNFDLSPSGIVMNSLDEKLLSQVKHTVESNMDNSKFSVEQLANSLHLSRMQLYRKLKALTGKSPNKIIREIRLQCAAQLLKSKQYNVADVTYMVGYNDLKYFRDQFKKEFGVSPSEYSKS